MNVGRDASKDVDAPRYTVEDIAERWNVDRVTVYRLARSGALESYKIGRLMRFSWRQIIDFEHRNSTVHGAPDQLQ